MQYEFHYDAGHGWLKVPYKELTTLGIREMISQYSYVDLDMEFAYLEEDLDAATFIAAKRRDGVFMANEIEEVNDGDDSPIRLLQPLSRGEDVEKAYEFAKKGW